MRRHPRRAEVDPTSPRGWATSDRNGHVGNLYKMRWQFEWRGASIVNTRSLMHEDELDIPQRQLGTLVIPPDPIPLINARPENYSIDEQPVSTRYTLGPNGLAQSIRIIMPLQEGPISNRIVTTPGGVFGIGIAGTNQPVITSFSPQEGPSGTVVTIYGVNFIGVLGVTFDGVAASFTIISNNVITAVVP